MSQLDIDYGRKLRDEGIQRAVDHAGRKVTGWIDYAYVHFEEYLKRHPVGFEFMIEDFREYLKTRLVEPPSNRAFGGIAVRGVRDRLISKAGHGKVKNSTAHRCFATIWKKR